MVILLDFFAIRPVKRSVSAMHCCYKMAAIDYNKISITVATNPKPKQCGIFSEKRDDMV